MALTAMLAAGCTEDATLAVPDGPVPVAFMTGINHAATRATTTRDNVWDGTEQIAVSDATGGITKNYQPESAGTSVALKPIDTSNTIYWPIDKGSRTFEAWYPYNSGTRPSAWTVESDQSAVTDDAYNAYDLLYASSGTVANGSTVTLNFYHQMAHVIVYIRGLAWTAQEISNIQFGNGNVAVTGTVTMGTTGNSPTASWSVAAADQTNTVTLRNLANTLTYECLLPPQTGGSALTPLLVFNTTTDQATYEASKLDNEDAWSASMASKAYSYNAPIALEAGKEYSFFIRLERVGMSVASTITDWDADVTSKEVEAIYQPMSVGGSLSDWEDPEVEANGTGLDFTYTE